MLICIKAKQTVYHEAKYASYIDLTVIPNRFKLYGKAND